MRSTAVEPFPDFRDIVDRKPAQLNLLAGGDVDETPAVSAADVADGAQLRCGHDAVGNPQAHHEMARRLPPKENAGPLEPLLVAIGDRLPTLGGIPRQVVE